MKGYKRIIDLFCKNNVNVIFDDDKMLLCFELLHDSFIENLEIYCNIKEYNFLKELYKVIFNNKEIMYYERDLSIEEFYFKCGV